MAAATLLLTGGHCHYHGCHDNHGGDCHDHDRRRDRRRLSELDTRPNTDLLGLADGQFSATPQGGYRIESCILHETEVADRFPVSALTQIEGVRFDKKSAGRASSLRQFCELVQQANPLRIGVAAGTMRYTGTELGDESIEVRWVQEFAIEDEKPRTPGELIYTLDLSGALRTVHNTTWLR